MVRPNIAPLCLPASDIAGDGVGPVDTPPDAACDLRAAPRSAAATFHALANHRAGVLHAKERATPHPLEPLAARAAWLLRDCEVSLIPGADGPTMLMVERMAADKITASHTWLLTPVSATTLELETIVGETRLDLVAEGPPDRVLAWLWRLNLRAARAAARRNG